MNYEQGVKHSMSLPWTPRPLYKTKATDTTPRRNRKFRRVYYHLKDDIGVLVMILAVFGACILAWGALAGVLQWLR